MDDTVLRCADALEDFVSKRLNIKSVKPLRDTYYVDKAFDISHDEAENVCHDFWTSDTFYNLKGMTCALNVLPRLYSAGYRFVAITACLIDDAVRARRKANLEHVFGIPWEDVHCTHGISKGVYLQQYEPSVWVEDHLNNCIIGAELGHRAFLINKEYNQTNLENEPFTRVTDWCDIENLLKK